jgi:hypothetical protein
MLKQDTPQQKVGLTQEEIQAKNTNPYATPASARMDPITGAPIQSNPNPGFGGGFGGFGQSNPMGGQPSAPFAAPNFAKFGSNPATDNGEGDLPF